MFKKIRDFNELVVFEHTIFSASFMLISLVTASNIINGTGWFGYKVLFLSALALISARNFAMAFNRYADIEIDKKNARTSKRPSADGRISPKIILLFAILNAAAFVIVAYFINNLAFVLSVPFLVILGGYSYFKRFSFLAHIVLGISLGLAPDRKSVV